MILPGPPLPQRHLQPGELLVTSEPQWVITLLGSCVAVTMFNARFRVAAMCHAMLSQPPGADYADQHADSAHRYVSSVVPTMAESFLRLGLVPAEVEVKLFGGGNVIDLTGHPHTDLTIGEANVALTRALLGAANFRITSANTGGDRGCKIVFNTQTGEVLHKRLSRGARRP